MDIQLVVCLYIKEHDTKWRSFLDDEDTPVSRYWAEEQKRQQMQCYRHWAEEQKRPQMKLKEEKRKLKEEERKLKEEERKLKEKQRKLKEKQRKIMEEERKLKEEKRKRCNALQQNIFDIGKTFAVRQKRQRMQMQPDLSQHGMLLSLFIFCISSQCSLGSQLGNSTETQSFVINYKIGGEFVDWKEANAECVTRGFELASKQDTDTWNEFAVAVSPIIPLNTKLWIDYHVEYTPWISEEGCYKSLGHFRHDAEFEINDNYRGTCAPKCKFLFFPSYFLLKGTECSCTDILKQFIQVDRKMCNVSCPGEMNQMCGGGDLYSVYQIENTLRLEEDRGLCVTYERSYSIRGTKEAWRSSPCLTFFNFICKVNEQYIIPPYKRSWTDAALSCTDEYNGFLVKDEETKLKLQPLMKNGTRYWVGKFRDVSIIHGREKSLVKKCLTVVKGTSELINTEVENCEENYRPLCQKVPVTTSSNKKMEDEDMTTESTLNHFIASPEPKQFAAAEYMGICICIAFGGLFLCFTMYVLWHKFPIKENDVDQDTHSSTDSMFNTTRNGMGNLIEPTDNAVADPHFEGVSVKDS